ncbi:MAG: hypothetical protein ABUT20_15365 [Bacteroidota bacterium]
MKIAILLFLMAPLSLWCQQPYKFKPKEHIAPATLFFLAGAADGLNQVISHQYPKFKKAFPDANDRYWSPAISFMNKYKNRDPSQGEKFPGSKTVFVFTTDAYHLTRFTEHLFLAGAVAVKFSQQKKKWYWYVAEMAGYWLVNRAGFALVYNRF